MLYNIHRCSQLKIVPYQRVRVTLGIEKLLIRIYIRCKREDSLEVASAGVLFLEIGQYLVIVISQGIGEFDYFLVAFG